MAVRQYIGARYVPKYAGDWDSTKDYEPLTIVTDANGNSFTSLKDVPAGTELSDRSYWIQTSSFSGAIDQLRRDVYDLQSTDVIQNEKIADLEEKVSGEKYAVWCGDSYIEAQSLETAGIQDWQTKRLSYLVSQKLGLVEKNFAKGGTGFVPYQSTVDYLQQIGQAVNTMTATEKRNTELVVFGGSRNDCGHFPDMSAAVYRGHIRNALVVAKNNFPNAKIVVIPMLSNSAPLDDIYTSFYSRNIQALYMIEPSESVGNVRIIEGSFRWNAGKENMMLSDRAHWNAEGHNYMANICASAIGGGDHSVNYKYDITALQNATGSVKINRMDDIILVYLDMTLQNDVARGTKFLNVALANDVPLTSGRDVRVPIANRNVAGNQATVGFAFIFDLVSRDNKIDMTAYTNIPAGSYDCVFMLPVAQT